MSGGPSFFVVLLLLIYFSNILFSCAFRGFCWYVLEAADLLLWNAILRLT